MQTSVPQVFEDLMDHDYWQIVKNDKALLRGWLMVLGITMYSLRYKYWDCLEEVIGKHDLEYELLWSCKTLDEAASNEICVTPLEVFGSKEHKARKQKRLTESSFLDLSNWCVAQLQELQRTKRTGGDAI